MGAKGVRVASNQRELNVFTQSLLRDIEALEIMLEEDWFDSTNIHIGAEQEICLVDENFKPAPVSMEILEQLDNPHFTTELARFNIEANLSPQPFKGNCFSALEQEIQKLLGELYHLSKHLEFAPVLTGILPTIRKFDLEEDNLTPLDRYYALIEAINKLRGKSYELKIEGIDELNIKQESALIEACNTSFQVHLQIKPQEFVQKYNIAQAIAAPVLAIGSNSPMLFGKRLWNETRIALFQQSIDTRLTGEHLRYTSPRVTFGNQWLKKSILELYREDIMRFKVLLTTDIEEDALECIRKGKTPQLRALNIHNSTVYRWNRACYGISPNGKPHLRIENRILPAGPSVLDEIANSAFWIGLMNGFEDAYPDITKVLDFDDARSNFLKAARTGLNTKYVWANEKIITDTDLIEQELLPIARKGLESAKIAPEDIDRYLGVIEERNKTARTGSRWILGSYAKLLKETTREEATNTLVGNIIHNQKAQKPIHEWELASLNQIEHWEPYSMLVEEFMTTDIITVNKDEILEFAADIMDWQNIRYIPIEDSKGALIGLITARRLLRYFTQVYKHKNRSAKVIRELMIKNPIIIEPSATVIQAMELMNKHRVGCLPVVNKQKLVGMITESNFLDITSSLFKRLAAKKQQKKQEEKAKNNG